MKLIRWLGCIFFLGALLLLVTSPALAWPTDPPAKATISGPGLKGEIEITDQKILSLLSLGAIEDFAAGPIPAPKVDEGYQITRYFYDASFDFGRLHYYPGLGGEHSYVFFEDGPAKDGQPSQYNRQWFYTTAPADAALQSLLKEITPAAPQKSIPTALPFTLEQPLWPVAGLIVTVMIALIYWRQK